MPPRPRRAGPPRTQEPRQAPQSHRDLSQPARPSPSSTVTPSQMRPSRVNACCVSCRCAATSQRSLEDPAHQKAGRVVGGRALTDTAGKDGPPALGSPERQKPDASAHIHPYPPLDSNPITSYPRLNPLEIVAIGAIAQLAERLDRTSSIEVWPLTAVRRPPPRTSAICRAFPNLIDCRTSASVLGTSGISGSDRAGWTLIAALQQIGLADSQPSRDHRKSAVCFLAKQPGRPRVRRLRRQGPHPRSWRKSFS
jgi:hypothetical protein